MFDPYPSEIFLKAVMCLTCGEGEVHSRLQSAWMELSNLTSEKIPENLRYKFNEIAEQGAKDQFEGLTIANATVMASRIFSLWMDLEALHREPETAA